MTAALITALETSLQKAGLESLVDKLRIPRVFQYMASVVFAQLLLSYTVIPFMALDWQRSIEGWRAVGFWAHWYWLVAIVVLKVAASSIRKEEKKMKSK